MRRRRVRGTACAAVLLAAVAVSASASDADSLANGEVVVRTVPVEGSDLPRVIVRGVIDAPPDRVWPLLDDCNDYERFMPRIRASRELSREDGAIICQITVGLPFPMSDLTSKTRAVHVVGPPRWSRTWTFIEGDYDANEGSWVLEPYAGDANRTLATYTVYAVPHTSVPAWARRRAQTSSMPEIIEALRAEVRRRTQ